MTEAEAMTLVSKYITFESAMRAANNIAETTGQTPCMLHGDFPNYFVTTSYRAASVLNKAGYVYVEV